MEFLKKTGFNGLASPAGRRLPRGPVAGRIRDSFLPGRPGRAVPPIPSSCPFLRREGAPAPKTLLSPPPLRRPARPMDFPAAAPAPEPAACVFGLP